MVWHKISIEEEMKKILCYGDSNTFGYNPANGLRFDENNRWSGILKSTLANKYEVIEEGLNNRTGFVKNLDGINHNTKHHFPKIVENIFIDILIFAIGTNDLQFLFDIDCNALENELITFIHFAKTKAGQIILIPPVIMSEDVFKGNFSHQFNKSSIIKSKQANKIYKTAANQNNIYCFDFNEFVKPSKLDGLHYDSKSHILIAKQLTEFINQIGN